MSVLAFALWHGPVWLRFPLAMVHWQVVVVESPGRFRLPKYEFRRLPDPWIHGGAWKYRWGAFAPAEYFT